ncbi:MAG TPA: flagellar motor switch protein FliG [Myxococcaceae bacterium]|nr:flagellar motor switch protein FliG [Myxococcaceae bacterium]
MAETAPARKNPEVPTGPGARRAAALLLGLGPEAASQIFKLLGEHEVRSLAAGAKALRREGGNTVPEALRDFVRLVETVGGETLAGDELLRDFASRALGPDVVRRTFDGIVPPPQPDEILGSVSQADPEALAMVLGREQPQTVALVLSTLDPERAVAVMDKLPPRLRPEVVRRMATLESVSPEVLREVGHALGAELRSVAAGGMRRVDGRSAALEILRRAPTPEQAEVVAQIEKEDPALATELKTKLFTFDDLANLIDRDVQALLKEVDMARLTLALKGAPATVKDKFLKNMSSRAAQMLADDLAALGPVRLAQVEAAQAEIARIAQTLGEQQRITLVRPTDRML